MAPFHLPIVLYHYDHSPYAKRVKWYLEFRKIAYSQCFQPPILPRPDVSRLGVAYRRIPLLTIGRDVYLDTRLILQKLESLYPPSEAHPSLSAPTGDARAVERLLSLYATDGGLFSAAVMMLPGNLPQMNDPRFQADRAEMMGVPKDGPSPISQESRAVRRPEALGDMRDAMELLETTLLADGRDWLLKTDGPTLTDIEAVFIPYWMANLPGAMPAEIMGDKVFPKVHAWIARFSQAAAAAEKTGAPKTVEGGAAAKLVLGSAFAEAAANVDECNAIVVAEGLKKGDGVRMWPTDTGSGHKEMGKLVGITNKEIVIEAQGEGGCVRIHAPRHGFKVKKHAESSPNL